MFQLAPLNFVVAPPPDDTAFHSELIVPLGSIVADHVTAEAELVVTLTSTQKPLPQSLLVVVVSVTPLGAPATVAACALDGAATASAAAVTPPAAAATMGTAR